MWTADLESGLLVDGDSDLTRMIERPFGTLEVLRITLSPSLSQLGWYDKNMTEFYGRFERNVQAVSGGECAVIWRVGDQSSFSFVKQAEEEEAGQVADEGQVGGSDEDEWEDVEDEDEEPKTKMTKHAKVETKPVASIQFESQYYVFLAAVWVLRSELVSTKLGNQVGYPRLPVVLELFRLNPPSLQLFQKLVLPFLIKLDTYNDKVLHRR